MRSVKPDAQRNITIGCNPGTQKALESGTQLRVKVIHIARNCWKGGVPIFEIPLRIIPHRRMTANERGAMNGKHGWLKIEYYILIQVWANENSQSESVLTACSSSRECVRSEKKIVRVERNVKEKQQVIKAMRKKSTQGYLL